MVLLGLWIEVYGMAEVKTVEDNKVAVLGASVFMRNAKSHKIYPAIICGVYGRSDLADLTVFRGDIGGGCFGEKAVKAGLKNGEWCYSLDMLKASIEYESNPIDLKPV